MKRNISLDLLKIIACFCVIVLHTIGINISLINSMFYYIAGLAVPIFFMVNGYLLFSKAELTYKYIIKKITNILTVVLLWNLLISILFLLKGEFKNPIIETIISLLQRGYFWQFWFFGSLIIVYSFIPILFKKSKKLKSAILITLLCVIISIIIDFTNIILSMLGDSIIQVHVIQTFRVWTWFAYFMLGALISKPEVRHWIYSKLSFKKNLIVLVILTVTIVLYQYNISRYVYHTLFAEYFYDNIFTFLWILSLFLFVYRIHIKNIKVINIIELLSFNTMGIYIIHVTSIRFMEKFYNFENSIINILMTFIIFFISLIASIVISKIPYMKRMIRL